MKRKIEKINLLELKPRQLHPSESEEGKVVVLVPKFPGKFAQWFMPKLSRSNFRVKLDAFGSFVWRNCNGETAVMDIADRMKIEFGDSVEPAYERVSEFIKCLHRDRLIDFGLIKQ
jgi:hypothetical protein